MADDRTERLGLPLLLVGQAQKEVTHNEALARIDIASCASVESMDLTVPPAAPVPGQCWIVAAGASGAWAGQEGAIAGWTGGGWRFVAPPTGMETWVADRGCAVRWLAGVWEEGALRSGGLYHGGVKVLGAQGDPIAAPEGGAVIDAECRAAVGAMLEMLRLHGIIASGA